MIHQTGPTPPAEIVHVLRLADAGWPEGCTWTTEAFTYACWNDLLGGAEDVTVTDKGKKFLATVGTLYPEEGR